MKTDKLLNRRCSLAIILCFGGHFKKYVLIRLFKEVVESNDIGVKQVSIPGATWS